VTWRRPVVAVAIVILAVALQTTLFLNLRPLDVTPALVLLVVFAVSRHLEGAQAVVLGFFSGLLLDLLSETPLGLWALVACAVAYATVRLRSRMEDDMWLVAAGVFVTGFGALALFALLGTIFGERTLADSRVVQKMLLPAVYNTILAAAVVPLITRAIGTQGTARRGWDL
jgi:rod shape-determining protein MreD